MKTVILTPVPTNTVLLSLVREDKYYGYENSGRKGFIGREDYMRGNFKVFSTNEFTNGNCFNFLENLSLRDLIRNCLDVGGKVYEFDSFAELARFLVDEGKKS